MELSVLEYWPILMLSACKLLPLMVPLGMHGFKKSAYNQKKDRKKNLSMYTQGMQRTIKYWDMCY